MARHLVFAPKRKKNGLQGDTPAAVILENVHAKLQDLVLEIDNGMDDNCVVAMLRELKEQEEQIDPEDVVDLLHQVRDWILDADIVVVAARSQISKRSKKA